MAITITTEANVSATLNANVEIIAANVGRKSTTFQIQSPGEGWVRLGGAASVGVGLKVYGGKIYDIAAAFASQGNSTDFYEGAVNLFWTGVPGADNNGAANVRVIDAE